MCSPNPQYRAGFSAFSALARGRGWTEDEITKAWAWMRDRYGCVAKRGDRVRAACDSGMVLAVADDEAWVQWDAGSRSAISVLELTVIP